MTEEESAFRKKIGMIITYCKIMGINYRLGSALAPKDNFEFVPHKKAVYFTDEGQELIDNIIDLLNDADADMPIAFEETLIDGGVYSYLISDSKGKITAEAKLACVIWGEPEVVWKALAFYTYGREKEFAKVFKEKDVAVAYIFARVNVFVKPLYFQELGYDVKRVKPFTYVYELPNAHEDNTRNVFNRAHEEEEKV